MKWCMSTRLASVLITIVLCASWAHAQVTIKKNPSTSEQKVIDPNNPPPEKKFAAPNHPAFTWCNYTAKWFMHYNTEKRTAPDGKAIMRLTITTMDLTLDLHSTIWLPA